jgi:putative hydroxymethylpyrimidine transport system substrate-binding protein
MRFKEKHIKMVTVVALLSSFGLFAYGLSESVLFSDTRFIQEPLTITISDPQQPIFGIVYVAEEKGFFREENLNVVYRKFLSGRDAMTDMLDGESDLAMAYENPIVTQILEGSELRIVTTLHSSSNNTTLLIRKNDRLNSVKDLKGRKVIMPLNTNTEMIFDSIMNEYSLSIKDVQIINSPVADIPDIFYEDTSISAAVVWNIHALRIARLFGENAIESHHSPVYNDITALVGNKEYVISHQAEVTKFLRALKKAKSYMENYPEESWKIVNNYLPIKYSDEEAHLFPQYSTRLTLDHVFLTGLGKETHWLIYTGRTSPLKVPDFRNFIHKEYLESVDPDLVTL